MKRKVLYTISLLLFITNIYGENIENKEMTEILAPIADMVIENDVQGKTIAVGKINDDSGRISILSNCIAESFETLLVTRGKNKNFMVAERENLSKILEEQKLELIGVVNEESAVKIGKITGVNLFCFIKYRIIGEKTTFSIKLVDCENGEIITSITKTIKLPEELTALANKFNENYSEENMVFIKKGEFYMGQDEKMMPLYKSNFKDDNKPMHKVKLSDYYVGKYEVTYEEFDKFTDETKYLTHLEILKKDGYYDVLTYREAGTKGKEPVIGVTHRDIVKYCNWLSKKRGFKPAYNEKSEELIDENGNVTRDITKVKGYRLLTEAEWEYAATGAEKSKLYIFAGSNNYKEFWNDLEIQSIGFRIPNEIGIYDMSGNVPEMCEDFYDENYYEKSPDENPCNFDITESDKNRLKIEKSGLPVRVFRDEVRSATIERGCWYLDNIGFRIARSK